MPENSDLYNPESPILILTLDSFHKNKNGTLNYNLSSSFLSTNIDQKNKDFIISTRRKIFNHLKRGEVKWHGSELERDDNDNLVLGKDFFINSSNGIYLPAVDRYDGDLFDGLRGNGREKLLHSKHHFLILSALYGFLKPFESIQFYSCQFGEKNICFELWTEQNGLSNVIIDYIQKYKITKIFDFTACDVSAYHESIDWDFVTKETNSEILHAYHKKTTSDKALKYFGRFIRDQLLLNSAEDLKKIQNGSIIDEILFIKKMKRINQKITDEERFKKMIQFGEHEFVEYKSSSLWSKNYSEKEIQNSTERDVKKYGRNTSKFVIAKTIAGFSNTDGGNIIIGIKENKNSKNDEIIGIESEYDKLEDPCPDGYRRMILDDIVKYYFSPDFFNSFTKYVNISFQKSEGKTLCWLQIKNADIPVFININREDCYYIRVDATTRQISGKQMSDYILKRFR